MLLAAGLLAGLPPVPSAAQEAASGSGPADAVVEQQIDASLAELGAELRSVRDRAQQVSANLDQLQSLTPENIRNSMQGLRAEVRSTIEIFGEGRALTTSIDTAVDWANQQHIRIQNDYSGEEAEALLRSWDEYIEALESQRDRMDQVGRNLRGMLLSIDQQEGLAYERYLLGQAETALEGVRSFLAQTEEATVALEREIARFNEEREAAAPTD
jgi:paraquat-inducible protein B